MSTPAASSTTADPPTTAAAADGLARRLAALAATRQPKPTPPARPDDPTLLVARLTGICEWICPRCTAMNRSLVDRFHGRVLCIMSGCRRKFDLGLLWLDYLTPELPPFNAVFLDDGVTSDRRRNKRLASLEDLPPMARPAIARHTGPVEWRCLCGIGQVDYLDWATGRLRCTDCREHGFIRVILRPAGRGGGQQTPEDWNVPVAHRRQGHARHRARRRGAR